MTGQRFQFLRRERDAQSLGDLARHFVLHFENILHLAIEAFRPQRKIRARVHQLRVDAQTRAGAADGARQRVGRAQLLADLRGSHRLIAKRQNRGPRKRIQPANFRKFGDHVFRDAVAQILVFLRAA